MGTVITIRPGKGRQSAAVEELRDQRDELTALLAERRAFAEMVVGLARVGQVRLAAGRTPANVLDELERLGAQELTRATAAIAALRAVDECPDGVDERHTGHGWAA